MKSKRDWVLVLWGFQIGLSAMIIVMSGAVGFVPLALLLLIPGALAIHNL